MMVEKKMIPELRFPGFEHDWKKRKLGTLVDFKSGGTPPKDIPEFWNGNIPWISAASMLGKYYSNSKRTITEQGLRAGSKISPAGSLLLLVRGSMLYNKVPVGIAEVDVAYNQDLKSLHPTAEINILFLYEWFMFSQHKLLSLVVGTGIGAGKIDTDELKKLSIYTPCFSEQQKIASFLTSVDERIQGLQKKKDKLTEYKKGVMQKLFSQEIRFKKEDGTDFPDWEEKKLGEICEINPTTNGIPESFIYIDLESVKNGSLLKEDTISKKLAPSRAQRKLMKGDVLFQMVRPNQMNNYYFEKRDNDYVASTGYAQLRSSKSSKFIYYAIHHKPFVNNVLARSTGSNYPAINSGDLAHINIKVPSSLIEQQKIATFLSSIDASIATVEKQIDQTQDFKKGLLQKMFC